MAGRTERVNAKDILDRVDGIVFEGDVVRGWIEQLERRARGTLRAASTNRYFDDEWKSEYQELSAALEALNHAREQLLVFKQAAAKREGKLNEPFIDVEMADDEARAEKVA
jgi:hypothetical protein